MRTCSSTMLSALDESGSSGGPQRPAMRGGRDRPAAHRSQTPVRRDHPGVPGLRGPGEARACRRLRWRPPAARRPWPPSPRCSSPHGVRGGRRRRRGRAMVRPRCRHPGTARRGGAGGPGCSSWGRCSPSPASTRVHGLPLARSSAAASSRCSCPLYALRLATHSSTGCPVSMLAGGHAVKASSGSPLYTTEIFSAGTRSRSLVSSATAWAFAMSRSVVRVARRSKRSSSRRSCLKSPRLRRPATSTGTRAMRAAGAADEVAVQEEGVQHVGPVPAEQRGPAGQRPRHFRWRP